MAPGCADGGPGPGWHCLMGIACRFDASLRTETRGARPGHILRPLRGNAGRCLRVDHLFLSGGSHFERHTPISEPAAGPPALEGFLFFPHCSANLLSTLSVISWDSSTMPKPVLLFILFALLITGCLSPAGEPLPPASVPPSLTATQTSPSSTSTATPVPSPTETIQPASTPEPYGCRRPPEDFTRVEVIGATLNQRTLSMLAHAQEFYGGVLKPHGDAITRGSYSNSVSASFGTHMGGGAVDLSVLSPGTYTVLWDSIRSAAACPAGGRLCGLAAGIRRAVSPTRRSTSTP